MKFVATRLIGGVLGLGPGIREGLTFADARLLMLAFGLGWVALFAVFALLHAHVLRRRHALELDHFGVYDAQSSLNRHLINVAVGIVSVLLVVGLPPRFLGFAGLWYFVLGPLHASYGYFANVRRKRLEVVP